MEVNRLVNIIIRFTSFKEKNSVQTCFGVNSIVGTLNFYHKHFNRARKLKNKGNDDAASKRGLNLSSPAADHLRWISCITEIGWSDAKMYDHRIPFINWKDSLGGFFYRFPVVPVQLINSQ